MHAALEVQLSLYNCICWVFFYTFLSAYKRCHTVFHHCKRAVKESRLDLGM